MSGTPAVEARHATNHMEWSPSIEANRFSVNFPERDTLRTGLLNCLNARSRGLTFRHRASCT